MNCRLTRSKIVDYIDDALYPGDRSDIDVHLCGCEKCRALYREVKSFSDTCAEFIVYPDKPYSFNVLRARMASIRPLDEIVLFLPKMHSQGLTARLATALLLLIFVALLPSTVRASRDTCAAAKRPFNEEKAKWEPEYQDTLDAQYRQQMVMHQNAARHLSDSA